MRRFVYSWQLGDEPTSRVTVRFEPVALGGTEVTVFHERIGSVAVRDDHAAGVGRLPRRPGGVGRVSGAAACELFTGENGCATRLGMERVE